MTTNFSLVQYRTPDHAPGTYSLGVSVDERILNSSAHLPWSSTLDLLNEWERAEDVLRQLPLQDLPRIEDAELIAPIVFPRKIFCAGANYVNHAKEMNTERPDSDASPFFFFKAPTTTVVGPDVDIPVYDLGSQALDWEAELAVVIGKTCARIDPKEAMSAVAGYLVSNDISARARSPRPNAIAPAFEWDWVSSKSMDGSCPIGPGLVPVWQIEDPHNLRIQLTVNGITKQDGNTRDLVVKIPELIAAASRITTLEPGDIILTGTPAGVGTARGESLHHGDQVSIEIEGIGKIRHRILNAKETAAHPRQHAESLSGN